MRPPIHATAKPDVLGASLQGPAQCRSVIKGDGGRLSPHSTLRSQPSSSSSTYTTSRPGASFRTTHLHITMNFRTLLPVVAAAAGALAQGVGQGKYTRRAEPLMLI
jgi:hypothetical protein